MNGRLLKSIKITIAILSLFALISADNLPVDKKKVKPEPDGSIEIVQPDEVQRIKDGFNSQIANLNAEIQRLYVENKGLQYEIEKIKSRLKAGGL